MIRADGRRSVRPPGRRCGNARRNSGPPPWTSKLLDSLRGRSVGGRSLCRGRFSQRRPGPGRGRSARPAARLGQPAEIRPRARAARPPPRLRQKDPVSARVGEAPPDGPPLRPGAGGPGPEEVRGRSRPTPSAGRSRSPRNAGSTSPDIVPPLPADLFPVTLRDEVMARLRTARDLTWAERERALRELAVVEKVGLRPVLPDRPRRRRVRPPQRHPPQPQGLGRVVLPDLAARHFPRQPGRLRPLLRALPQQPAAPTRPTSTSISTRATATRSWPTSSSATAGAGRARPSSAA